MRFENGVFHGENTLRSLGGDDFDAFVEVQNGLAEFRIVLDHPEENGGLVLRLGLLFLLRLGLLLFGLLKPKN